MKVIEVIMKSMQRRSTRKILTKESGGMIRLNPFRREVEIWVFEKSFEDGDKATWAVPYASQSGQRKALELAKQFLRENAK
jgi:hypothetical protein